MKIAIVHSFYSSLVPSGENNVVMEQISALERQGHEVMLIARYTDEDATNPLYKIRTALNVATQRGASPLSALRDFDPDVVHVHNLFPNFSRSWLQSWNGPLVATLHNFRPVCAAGTLFRNGQPCAECINHGSHRAVINRCYRSSAIATVPLALQTRSGIQGDPVLRRADRIIVLADRAHQMYQSLGVDHRRLDLLPNFVDSRPFTPNAGPGQHWTYIGRLAAEKGIITLINSWPDDQELRIYGDGPLRQAVDDLASHLPNVRYLGSVPRPEIPQILAESRGLVFPSEWPEGAPLVYVEALAAGRPVIARHGNSVADDVAANFTGLVYTNKAELRDRLVAASSAWRLYHSRAISRFESAYSMTAWTEKIEQIYVAASERTGK